jgi:hypothetical protein
MFNWLALNPDQRKTIITSVAVRSGFPQKSGGEGLAGHHGIKGLVPNSLFQ